MTQPNEALPTDLADTSQKLFNMIDVISFDYYTIQSRSRSLAGTFPPDQKLLDDTYDSSLEFALVADAINESEVARSQTEREIMWANQANIAYQRLSKYERKALHLGLTSLFTCDNAVKRDLFRDMMDRRYDIDGLDLSIVRGLRYAHRVANGYVLLERD